MAVQAAHLKVKVSGDTKDAEQSLKNVDGSVQKTGHGLKGLLGTSLSTFTGMLGANAVANAFGFLKDQVIDTVKAGMDAQQMEAQLVQGLKSTHDASGETAQGLEDLAEKYSQLTTFSKTAIEQSEGITLTYTNIGKNIFPQATMAAEDMATRLGISLPNATTLLDKALNDPIQGLTALRRVGVQLSKAQDEQVKHFMAVGDVADAQKVILGELKTEMGGSAEAAGGTFAGALQILGNQMEDTKEKVGMALLPILTSLFKLITPLAAALSQGLANGLQAVSGFVSGTLTPALQPLLTALPSLWGLVQNLGNAFLFGLKPPIDVIGKAFKDANPLLKGTGDALDKVHGFAKKLQPPLLDFHKIVGQITDTLKNLAPVARDVGGVIGQMGDLVAKDILPPIKDLAQLWLKQGSQQFQIIGNVIQGLLPGILKLGDTLFKSIVPVLGQLLDALAKVGGALDSSLFKTIQTDILPVLLKLGNTLLDQIGKTIQQVMPFVSQIISGVQQFALFIATNVIPQVGKFASFMGTSLVPIVKTLFQVFRDDILPVLKTLWNNIETNVIPALEKIWNTVSTQLIPAIEKLWAKIEPILIPALQFLGNLLKAILTPALNILGWVIGHVVGPAIGLAINLIAGIITGFVDVIGAIGGVLGWFGHLKDGIGDLLGHLGKLKDTITNDIAGAFKGLASGIGNAFGNLWGIVKSPINSIIGGLDTLIQGLDNLRFNIPSWVPVIGGKTWSMNIPLIPKLAEGGKLTSSGDVMVGERGPEVLHLPSGASVTPLSRSSNNSSTEQTIIIQLDGLTVARSTVKHMPSVIRLATGTRAF